MAMTGAGLFNAVKAKLAPAQDLALQEAALKPICEAIVEYITGNAQVAVNNDAVKDAEGRPLVGVATGTIS